MRRRSRSNRHILTTSPIRRDASVIATRSVHDRFISKSKPSFLVTSRPFIRRPFTDVQDHRRFSFNSGAPILNFSGSRSTVVPNSISHIGFNKPRSYLPRLPVKLKILNPHRVLLCVRRSMRKGVIHALGIAGTRVNKPRFRQTSQFSCRS